MSQITNLSLYLKKVEKEHKKPKARKIVKEIKMKAEINEIEKQFRKS